MDNPPSASLQEERDRAWFGTPEPPGREPGTAERERAVPAPDVTFLWTPRSKTVLRERRLEEPGSDEASWLAVPKGPAHPKAPLSVGPARQEARLPPRRASAEPEASQAVAPAARASGPLWAALAVSALLAAAMLMSVGLIASALLVALLALW